MDNRDGLTKDEILAMYDEKPSEGRWEGDLSDLTRDDLEAAYRRYHWLILNSDEAAWGLERVLGINRAYEADITRLTKLLHDLTPGGSEYADNPDLCARYVQDTLQSKAMLTVAAYVDRNAAQAEAYRLRAEVETLRTKAVQLQDEIDNLRLEALEEYP